MGLQARLVVLPGLPPKGDVSDWLDMGHTKEELLALVEAQTGPTPSIVPGSTPCSAPLVDAPPPVLRDLLQAVRQFIRKYVVLTNEQATMVALWVAHTHALAGFDCTPYLQITSATMRAGKSTLLEVLERLVPRAWYTGRVTAAVLVRKIDAAESTLLLDESDAAFNGEPEYAQALRGVLNSGFRRGGTASLCVGQGAKITFRDFSTFGAKAIAGIGRLPGTIADRALRIQLKRRKASEPRTRWRIRDGQVEAAPLYSQLVTWAADGHVIEHLRQARPSLPAGLDDRKQDVLEPLVAIADLAGEAWGKAVRTAAVAVAEVTDESDLVVELLRDVRDILTSWPASETVIPTTVLIAKLTNLDERPWGTWGKPPKPLTPHALARLLGPLDIHSKHFNTGNGYRRDAFADAFERYLSPQKGEKSGSAPGPEASVLHDVKNDGPELSVSKASPEDASEAFQSFTSPITTDTSEGVKLSKGGAEAPAIVTKGADGLQSFTSPISTDTTGALDVDPSACPVCGHENCQDDAATCRQKQAALVAAASADDGDVI
jgi:hypothetical protein